MTVRGPKSSLPSGTLEMPCLMIRWAGFPWMAAPSKRILPSRGVRRPVMVLRSVVFPAPLLPRIATTSWGWTFRETHFRACASP